MCGIYGFVSRKETIDPEVMHRMSQALAHRGPDDGHEITRRARNCS